MASNKQIAVLGLGHFGSEVALRLMAEGCEVLAVDVNEEYVDELKDQVTRAVVADAADEEVLRDLHIKEFDAVVVALGGSLEGSILCCMHLKELGVKNIIAKFINKDHARILKHLGIPRIVNPEQETARRVAKNLTYSSVLDFVSLADGFSIMEVAPAEEIVGNSLIDAQIRQRYNVQVVAIHDVLHDVWRVVPDPKTVIKDSDVLVVIGKDEDLSRIARKS
jgi:trk system potassium uptake protein